MVKRFFYQQEVEREGINGIVKTIIYIIGHLIMTHLVALLSFILLEVAVKQDPLVTVTIIMGIMYVQLKSNVTYGG